MRYPKSNAACPLIKDQGHSRHLLSHQRSTCGAMMPVIALFTIVMLIYMGVVIDLTRDFQVRRELQFAAESSALYGLSLAADSNGAYTNDEQTHKRIKEAILDTGQQPAWNSAQSGPNHLGNSLIWSTPVTLKKTDIQVSPEAGKSGDLSIQLTARRDDKADVLKQFFLPVMYTANILTGGSVPSSIHTFSTHRTVEVIGQPASRIGPGAPYSSKERAAELAGFAALPIAISNIQFNGIANFTQTHTIDFVSSANPTPAKGHLAGCFVNVAASRDKFGSNYYGTAKDHKDIQQLVYLLQYFATKNSTLLPATVERGSKLNAFDPASKDFNSSLQLPNIQLAIDALSLSSPPLKKRYYLVPVLTDNLSFTSKNAVAGFACLQLIKPKFSDKKMLLSLQVRFGKGIIMRNTSSATGFSSIPGNENSPLPPAQKPFQPRKYNLKSNEVTSAPSGVVLAPALSPQTLPPPS